MSPAPSRKRTQADTLPFGLRIVHEDDDLIVVDKPAGLLSSAIGDQNRRRNVFDILKRRAAARRARVWIVHRLDRDASGLLVFAKSERAFHWIKEDLRAKRIERLYTAVVEGEVNEPAQHADPLTAGTIQSVIAEDDEGTMRTVRGGEARSRDPDAPKLAVTHWRLLHAARGHSLLELRLETGRKNQIRVHLSEWGHPIVGDGKYGARANPIARLALHAHSLSFNHPGTGRPVTLTIPAPESFYRCVGLHRPPPPAPVAPQQPAAPEGLPDTSWDHVAAWYDQLIDDKRSDHFPKVILPGVLRLLSVTTGERVLDVACGQGDLGRAMARLGAEVVGIDAAPALVAAARKRAGTAERYEVQDARTLDVAALGEFDAATCVMALMNMDPLEPVLRGIASRLKPGGRLVAVILHPAFRAPGQTSWGWEGDAPPARKDQPRRTGPEPSPVRQYRRVDGYLSHGQSHIVMNPGAVARGSRTITTTTFHRPIQAYAKAVAGAGLLIDSLEEWTSVRMSQPGPRAAEENRARKEIPMFLAFRARKAG